MEMRSDGILAPVWIDVLNKMVGMPELVKGRLNPAILKMFEATHYPPNALTNTTPWCSALLCSVFESLSIDSPRSASSTSWLKWGTDMGCIIGSVVVFEWPRKMDTGPTDHHVSIVTGIDHDSLLCLGGNQSNTVKHRWYPRNAAMGFRYPANPKAPPALPTEA